MTDRNSFLLRPSGNRGVLVNKAAKVKPEDSDRSKQLIERRKPLSPARETCRANEGPFVEKIAGALCEEISTGLRCSERMGPGTGWSLDDWCYTCQARAALGLAAPPTPMDAAKRARHAG